MKIPDTKPQFDPHPEYIGPAVCVDVTPGRQVPSFNDPSTMVTKFKLVFETTHKDPKTGKPLCVWSKPLTATVHEKGKMREMIRQWWGRDLTATERKEFDNEIFLGMTAKIVVAHSPASDGTIYANIASCAPLLPANAIKSSGLFVREKDRQTRNNVTQPAATVGIPSHLAAKIVGGQYDGHELRDIPEKGVLAVIEHWLPSARLNPKPTVAVKALIAALDWWLEQRDDPTPADAADDTIPFKY